MRLPKLRRLSLALGGAATLAVGMLATLPASAQNPSAAQIIEGLKPTGTPGASRGIRPVTVPAGAAPAPAAAPSVSLNVQFDSGSAELTAAARQTLDELGRALTSPQLAGYRFRIAGHTDTVGSVALNKTLSERRAAAVASYLISHFGVAAARLDAVGLGEDGLLVQTPDQTDEPRNRRVEVVNIGA